MQATPATDAPEALALRERMRAMGPRYALDINAHRAEVMAAYTPLLASRPLLGLRRHQGITYGVDPRQVLEVYQPAGLSQPAPVVMFVHGGAFLRGAMNPTDQVYGNVPRFFARQGCVAVNVEYRLAPQAAYPSGSQDVAASVAWVREHAAEFGGDAQRILLIGHSAGGTHVAGSLCDPMLEPVAPMVAGVALISARLRADVLPVNPNAGGVRAYYGDDPANHEANAPMRHAARWPAKVPLLVAVAEFENPLLDVYGLEFAHRVAQVRGHAPRVVWVEAHNHTSLVAHIDSGEHAFGTALLDFLHRLMPST